MRIIHAGKSIRQAAVGSLALAAFFVPAPLATAEHEAEAEAVEAQVLSGNAPPGAAPAPAMTEEEMIAQVMSRVAELLYEEERVFEARNGETRIRP